MAKRRYSRQGHIVRELAASLFGSRMWPRILTVLGVVFLICASTVLWWSRDLPSPDKIENSRLTESTKIYDSTGTHLLYEIGEARRTRVGLADISPTIVNATLAIEDDQFYQHHGLDFKGILRGVILKPLTGQRAQGGSTITQQLIKNSILSPERTPQRKAKEMVLAIEMEQRFSKDEIMEMYLNTIPYGSRAFGVEAAAQTFFATSSKNVSLAQAAIIAAVANAPTYYSPYGSHFEDLKARQEHTINRMVELNMISIEEGERAKKEELSFQAANESIQAPHFVFYVKELLDAEYGERVVEEGGLKVFTTLDMRLQLIAEEALKEAQTRLKQNGASNSSVVSINPSNGDILAMAGSIDYFNEEIDGNVNVSVRHRSPGSSIKPFIYAAAFEKGFTPETILVDAETDFGKGYTPKNYDLGQRGPVTMRTALANSLNIPAVQALYLAGVKNATALAQKMGMESLDDPDRYGLSLVLGGGEVRLLDITSAYGVFASEGTRYPARAIAKVETNKETLFDITKETAEGKQVLDAQISRLVTNVLSDNNARALVFGTGSYLQLGSRPVAAKTGTAQEYRDAWTVGFTPSLVTGVWVGNNDNSPMGKRADGSVVAAPIWNSIMRKALEGTPIEQFTRPQPLNNLPHAVLRGELPEIKGKWIAETKTFYNQDCPVAQGQNRTFKELHSVLYYVRSSNPLGPPPDRAESDPQFDNWESAVSRWRDKHNQDKKDDANEPIYVSSLPTPNCGVESAEDLPKVKIDAPNSSILKESPVKVEVEVDSKKPIKEVRFIWDKKEVARREGNHDSYEASFSFDGSFSGRKTLQVLAITEDNLIGQASRTFVINPDDNPPAVTLHTPTDNSKFKADSFPQTIKVTATDSSGIDFVDVLYTKDGQSGTSRIGRTNAVSSTASNRYEVKWDDSPGPGKYEVYAVAYDKTGNSTKSKEHEVTVD